MFNTKNVSLGQWILTKFEVKNTGNKSLKGSDTIDWINAYLPTGEKATLLDTCTFGDLPNYNTVIEPGETKEVWFGYFVMKSQGIPYLKLKNGAYISTHPSCSKGHKYSNDCDGACNFCHGVRKVTHSYKTTTTKATIKKNGSIIKKCTKCSKVASKSTIKYAKTIKLSATTYTYNGKVKKPTVTVKDSAGKKIATTHYTVTYAAGRKNVGSYKVTIKFKGNYSGTKTLTFKVIPKAASISSLTAGSKKLTVKLNRSLKQSTGYQIQYSTSKTFKSSKTKTITSYKTSSTNLNSLKAKTTYYVRVRTYKTVGKTKYYSNWSSLKYKKTK